MMYEPNKTLPDTTSSAATFQTKTIPSITRLENLWQLIIFQYISFTMLHDLNIADAISLDTRPSENVRFMNYVLVYIMSVTSK